MISFRHDFLTLKQSSLIKRPKWNTGIFIIVYSFSLVYIVPKSNLKKIIIMVSFVYNDYLVIVTLHLVWSKRGNPRGGFHLKKEETPHYQPWKS